MSTLCDKVCRWLTTGRLFSPVSFTYNSHRHDITEIFLKVVLNTITLSLTPPPPHVCCAFYIYEKMHMKENDNLDGFQIATFYLVILNCDQFYCHIPVSK